MRVQLGVLAVFLSLIGRINLSVRRLAADAERDTMAVHLSGRVHQVQATVYFQNALPRSEQRLSGNHVHADLP